MRAGLNFWEADSNKMEPTNGAPPQLGHAPGRLVTSALTVEGYP